MDESWKLLKQLKGQRDDRLKAIAPILRMAVRHLKNMNPAQRQEYKRIAQVIKESNDEFQVTLRELESFDQESATDERIRECVLRMTAALEHNLEGMTQVTKDYRQLVLSLVAHP